LNMTRPGVHEEDAISAQDEPAGKMAARGSRRRPLESVGNTMGSGRRSTRASKALSEARAAPEPQPKRSRRSNPASAQASEEEVSQSSVQTASSTPQPLAEEEVPVTPQEMEAPEAVAAAVEEVELEPVDDIDANDGADQLMVQEYVHEIQDDLREKEVLARVNASYMDDQGDVNEKMRAILVDWLVEVHLKFKLRYETLFLTVNLIDRYLERAQTERRELQLVGVVALLVASKYEEIYAPEKSDIVYICDNAYTNEEVLAMEQKILAVLGFRLTVPTVYNFLSRFHKAAGSSEAVEKATGYLIELCLVEYHPLVYLPSQFTAAAICLARILHGQGDWTRTLEHYTGYAKADLIGCMRYMRTVAEQAETHPLRLKAVQKKYTRHEYGNVPAVLSGPLAMLRTTDPAFA